MAARLFALGSLAVAMFVSLVLGIAGFERARRKGRFYSYSILMIVAAAYAGIRIVKLSSAEFGYMLALIGLEFACVAMMSAAYLFIVRDFIDEGKPRFGRRVAVLLVPAITVTLGLTISRHGLLYVGHGFSIRSGLPSMAFEPGPWYWVNAAYQYAVLAYASFRFFMAARSGAMVRRAQARFMLAGTLVPLAVGLSFLVIRAPGWADPTPLAFAVSGILFAAGFFKYRLFDVHPVGRDMVFEQMRDAAILIDHDGCIVDHNRAAEDLLPALAESARGMTMGSLLVGLPDLDAFIKGGKILSFKGRDSDRRYEVRRSVVKSAGDLEVGFIYFIIDVTERERLQERLSEMASLDELTKVPNRRRFYELASIELERARRHGRPIGFAMMDLDGFKAINDKYGHLVGDEALKLAARLSVDALRSCDIVGRIGGDEFAFVFPECDEAGAKAASDKVGQVVRSATFASGGALIALGASIGSVGASGPTYADLEDYLSTADERMYLAKRGVKRGATGKKREPAA